MPLPLALPLAPLRDETGPHLPAAPFYRGCGASHTFLPGAGGNKPQREYCPGAAGTKLGECVPNGGPRMIDIKHGEGQRWKLQH
jgi:hypothetical protein